MFGVLALSIAETDLSCAKPHPSRIINNTRFFIEANINIQRGLFGLPHSINLNDEQTPSDVMA